MPDYENRTSSFYHGFIIFPDLGKNLPENGGYHLWWANDVATSLFSPQMMGIVW